jgi:hypothetical protein
LIVIRPRSWAVSIFSPSPEDRRSPRGGGPPEALSADEALPLQKASAIRPQRRGAKKVAPDRPWDNVLIQWNRFACNARQQHAANMVALFVVTARSHRLLAERSLGKFLAFAGTGDFD